MMYRIQRRRKHIHRFARGRQPWLIKGSTFKDCKAVIENTPPVEWKIVAG